MLLRNNARHSVKYRSGKAVPGKDSTDYLGVVLTAGVDIKKEIGK